MNCQEWEALIPDLARNAGSEVEIPEAALAHSRQCERCAERLDEERRLTGRLAAFAAACANEQAPERAEQKLRAAFRLRTVPMAVERVRRKRGWVALAALGSVAAVVLWVRLPFQRVEPLPPVAAATAIPAVDLSVKPVAQMSRASRSLRGPARQRPSPMPAELKTDFFPVAQGDDWTPVDGARLMRVELPKSALGAFGLPAEQGLGPERVRADVVLSDDGLLRAIRFVR